MTFEELNIGDRFITAPITEDEYDDLRGSRYITIKVCDMSKDNSIRLCDGLVGTTTKDQKVIKVE